MADYEPATRPPLKMVLIQLLIGVVLLGYSGLLLWQALLPDYATTIGTVVQAEKRVYKQSNPRPDRLRYFFAYDYDWQGKSYRSDRYTYGGRDAIEGVCRFNVGDKITVYVNRDSPDQAVAKRDISHFVVGMAILGILIVLYALLGVAAAIGPEAIARRTPAMLRIGGAVIGLGILIGPLGYLVYVMLTPTC